MHGPSQARMTWSLKVKAGVNVHLQLSPHSATPSARKVPHVVVPEPLAAHMGPPGRPSRGGPLDSIFLQSLKWAESPFLALSLVSANSVGNRTMSNLKGVTQAETWTGGDRRGTVKAVTVEKGLAATLACCPHTQHVDSCPHPVARPPALMSQPRPHRPSGQCGERTNGVQGRRLSPPRDTGTKQSLQLCFSAIIKASPAQRCPSPHHPGGGRLPCLRPPGQ